MDNYSLSVVDTNNYALTVIDDKELSITLFGPAGPEGNEGATGATGLTGATGFRGATGVTTVTSGGPAQSIQFKVGTYFSGNENFTYDQGINLVQLINGGRLLVEGGTFPAIEVVSSSGHGVQSTTSSPLASPFVGYSEFDGCTFSSAFGTAAEISSNYNHALYTHSYTGTTQLVSEYNYGAAIQSFSSAGAYIESTQSTGAIIIGGTVSDLSNFPAAHCRFGVTADTSLSIKSSDGSLYWRLGTDGTQTCTLARPSAITGQRIATLPNSSGSVLVANTKSSSADLNMNIGVGGTTFTTAAGLSYPATDLLANCLYKMELFAQVTHGTGYYKLQALFGSSVAYAIGYKIATSTSLIGVVNSSSGSSAVDLGGVSTGSTFTAKGITTSMTFKVGASNTTLDIQFAQTISSGTSSTLLAGATVTLTKIV